MEAFNCPQCGATLEFERIDAPFVRCQFCNSMVVVPAELRPPPPPPPPPEAPRLNFGQPDQPKGGTPEKKADVALTAEEFFKEFRADEKATRAKYNGKLVEITATVWAPNVSEPFHRLAVVSAVDPKTNFPVMHEFFLDRPDAGKEKELRLLSRGQKVTIRGRHYDIDNRTPSLHIDNWVWGDSGCAGGTLLANGRCAPNAARNSLPISYTKDNARGEAILLNLAQREQPVVLGPHAHVDYIALSPDGRWAATGSWHNRLVQIFFFTFLCFF